MAHPVGIRILKNKYTRVAHSSVFFAEGWEAQQKSVVKIRAQERNIVLGQTANEFAGEVIGTGRD